MLVAETKATLLQEQKSSPCHLAKSISQVATNLYRSGYASLGRELLEWCLRDVYVDSYLFTGLVRCCLATGDLAEAERVLEDSRAVGAVHEAAYTAVVHFLVRKEDFEGAERVRARAVQLGVADDLFHAALIDAYCKTNRMPEAEALFEQARARGMAGASCYAALISGYARQRRLGEAQLLYEDATRRSLTGAAKVLNSLLKAYGECQHDSVGQLFAQGIRRGHVDSRVYDTAIRIFAKLGDYASARAYLERARENGLASDEAYATVIEVNIARGHLSRARGLLKVAKAEGRLLARGQSALRQAYRLLATGKTPKHHTGEPITRRSSTSPM